MTHLKSKFKSGAIELASVIEGTTDIALLGPEGITSAHDFAQQFGDVEIDYDSFKSDVCSFNTVIGTGYRCYYTLDEFYEDDVVIRERGIGSVKESNGEFVLQRDNPIAWANEQGESRMMGPDQHVGFGLGKYIIAMSVPPPTYLEALHAPHSVIASTLAANPTPVEIEPSCLLGRKDNMIQSIDMGELEEMFGDRTLNQLTSTQKQLDLKARHLRLTRKNASIASPVIRMLPRFTDTEKPPEVEGSLIYNTDSKRLQYFDGSDWKTLKIEEE